MKEVRALASATQGFAPGVLFVLLALGAMMPLAARTVTLTDKDAGSKISLTVDDHVVLQLPVVMGTGYSWKILGIDKEVLALQGEPRVTPLTEPKPGGGEMEVFRFVAKRKGETKLELELTRAWEKRAKPSKTFSVTVTVG